MLLSWLFAWRCESSERHESDLFRLEWLAFHDQAGGEHFGEEELYQSLQVSLHAERRSMRRHCDALRERLVVFPAVAVSRRHRPAVVRLVSSGGNLASRHAELERAVSGQPVVDLEHLERRLVRL